MESDRQQTSEPRSVQKEKSYQYEKVLTAKSHDLSPMQGERITMDKEHRSGGQQHGRHLGRSLDFRDWAVNNGHSQKKADYDVLCRALFFDVRHYSA
jgi:hypothetical protein